jgi:type IV secretion system protein VirB8
MKFYFNLKQKLTKSIHQKQPNKNNQNQNYFQQAQSWADDYYTLAIASRNRYRWAFLSCSVLCMSLALAITTLVPLQHLQPLLINHYPDGRVSVQPLNQHNAPIHSAQVQSDLVRYVINRESFDASSYPEQFELVNLMSANEVAKQYEQSQDSSNTRSPINALGSEGIRKVHVDSVVFLDKANLNPPKAHRPTHRNLAQIDFTLTDIKDGLTSAPVPLTALVSWTYRGTPDNPDALWQNPFGFTVTRFDVEQRNV